MTTRTITSLVGNPYKPLFATVTGKGPHPKYILHHLGNTKYLGYHSQKVSQDPKGFVSIDWKFRLQSLPGLKSDKEIKKGAVFWEWQPPSKSNQPSYTSLFKNEHVVYIREKLPPKQSTALDSQNFCNFLTDFDDQKTCLPLNCDLICWWSWMPSYKNQTTTWDPKQQFSFDGCFSRIIPNLDIRNG